MDIADVGSCWIEHEKDFLVDEESLFCSVCCHYLLSSGYQIAGVISYYKTRQTMKKTSGNKISLLYLYTIIDCLLVLLHGDCKLSFYLGLLYFFMALNLGRWWHEEFVDIVAAFLRYFYFSLHHGLLLSSGVVDLKLPSDVDCIFIASKGYNCFDACANANVTVGFLGPC